MKTNYTPLSIFIIFMITVSIRAWYSPLVKSEKPLRITTYDAFGYYMYLPSTMIYNDATQLKWLPAIDAKYNVIGGWQYQTIKGENGNFIFKYLGGVSLMQLPFFLVGHVIAKWTDYPADGFSAPYQYALLVAAFFYAFLGLVLLRSFLLFYFEDKTVSLTLLLLTLATNWLQYVAVDSAMSHVYIFPLYALILILSKKWHDKPSSNTAFFIGLTIGLATICRPTEGVMLFVPLLWQTHTKMAATAKWAQVKANKSHVWIAIFGGLLVVLPQLIYWKIASGKFIIDTGSKWVFLNPYFRVLFGFEKGWFVYTPITILFVLGLFFIKKYPFGKSIITFCLLNVWIIIAWDDWHYGASYSCRALVQSYPIFAVALAVFIEKINITKWKSILYVLFFYFIIVNLFQIYQYNANIIRYDENSFEYYKSIYLNPYAQPYKN